MRVRTNTAFQDGLKNGRTDRRLGHRLESVWYSVESSNPYTAEYSQAYRTGWLNPETKITKAVR